MSPFVAASAVALARAALPVGVIADDLTGALDAAAPFARRDAPVAVLRRIAQPTGSFALDAGTRGASEAAAEAAAGQSARLLRGMRTAFRKIDSLLRGWPAAEIAATARAGRFASVVVAPAFPAQGRITLQGRQYVRHVDDTYRLVDVDLRLELAARGMPVRAQPEIGAMEGVGVFLCDAEEDADLGAIATARERLKPPVLWCGSSGLARALAGMVRTVATPTGPYLGVVGSRHDVSHAQAEMLRSRDPGAVVELVDRAHVDAAVGLARARIERGLSVLVALRLPPLPPASAAEVLGALARALAGLRPAALFASGGDTLAALRDAAGATQLEVIGEAAAGIPVSRLVDGRWNAMPVVSKSGAFAAAETMAQIFVAPKEKRRARA
ncbi:MAG: Hrp-dependent type III effector protein [Alphaproteobacteria bacterium]|nr:Hrp-dependent type III effector protein [Alphaproteobacteria bacterium]